MIDLYIAPHYDNKSEEAIIAKAKDLSYDEGVHVHWHFGGIPCEAKFEHAIFKDGHANRGGSGEA